MGHLARTETLLFCSNCATENVLRLTVPVFQMLTTVSQTIVPTVQHVWMVSINILAHVQKNLPGNFVKMVKKRERYDIYFFKKKHLIIPGRACVDNT